MARVTVEPDCSNAPRKLFLKDWYPAMAKSDIGFIGKNIDGKISWRIAGVETVTGSENFFTASQRHHIWNVHELVIDTIITHGPDASVSGRGINRDQSAFLFCDVIRFKGAGGTTIQAISSFIAKPLT
jgi:hypothetical protein